MMDLQARVFIFDYTEDQIWELEDRDKITLYFEDTSEPYVFHPKYLILNWYLWQMYKEDPSVPISSKFRITDRFDNDVFLNVLSHLLNYVYESHNINRQEDTEFMWSLSEKAYRISNMLYNATVSRISKDVVTVSLYDIADVTEEPRILEARTTFKQATENKQLPSHIFNDHLKTLYNRIKELLGSEDSGIRNGITDLYRSGVLSIGQACQLLGAIGYVHDVNQKIFQYPITTSYVEGLQTAYDYLIETRKASVASHSSSSEVLGSIDHFSKQIQFLCSAIKTVSMDDCGSYYYIKYLIENTKDLFLLSGKYFKFRKEDPIDRSMYIHQDRTDLIGKTVYIRSILGCRAPRQTVCRTCLGLTYRYIPPTDNVGYYISTSIASHIQQMLLSTKHLLISSKEKPLKMTPENNEIFVVDIPTRQIYLSQQVRNKKIILRVAGRIVKYINSLHLIDPKSLDNAVSEKVGSLNDITLAFVDDIHNLDEKAFKQNCQKIRFEIGKVGVNLAPSLLRYLQNHGRIHITSGKYGYIVLDTDYPYDQPVFRYTRVVYSWKDFGDNLNNFLINKGNKESKTISKYESRHEALRTLVSMIQTRMDLNIVQAEIIVKGCLCRDPDANDYRVPIEGEPYKFVDGRTIILKRSLSQVMIYGENPDVVFHPYWNINDKLTGVPLDTCFHN